MGVGGHQPWSAWSVGWWSLPHVLQPGYEWILHKVSENLKDLNCLEIVMWICLHNQNKEKQMDEVTLWEEYNLHGLLLNVGRNYCMIYIFCNWVIYMHIAIKFIFWNNCTTFSWLLAVRKEIAFWFGYYNIWNVLLNTVPKCLRNVHCDRPLSGLVPDIPPRKLVLTCLISVTFIFTHLTDT